MNVIFSLVPMLIGLSLVVGMSSVSANTEKLSLIRLQWVHWSTEYTGNVYTDFYWHARHMHVGKRRCPSLFSALAYTVSV
jgi:hypothetical protein